MITGASFSGLRTHPMNADLGAKVCNLVERAIKQHNRSDVRWRTFESDGEQSVTGFCQVYSDKSFANESFSFYPLHLLLLNLTESKRRKMITSGASIISYLPIKFESKSEENLSSKFTRIQLLQALHKSIEYFFLGIIDAALPGISVVTEDKKKIRFHLVLASYVADIPESEDLVGVKRRVRTKKPCHRCLIPVERLSYCTREQPRSIKNTYNILNRGEESRHELEDLSMHSLPPVLSKFPHAGIHPCVDSYSIFRFEPLHNFSLGVSKLIKECASDLLRDEKRFTSNITKKDGTARSFSQVRKKILHTVNRFLQEVEQTSKGHGIHVDYSKGVVGPRLNGFFTENGIIGMLEGKDYEAMDIVSPFLGAILDMCCGEQDNAPITRTYTKYSEILNFVNRSWLLPGWDDASLRKLKSMIKSFKEVARMTFEKYQVSGMGTTKFHSLDHLVDDLKVMGGIEYLHGGLFEKVHKILKEDYALTSKRVNTAMQEAIVKNDERRLMRTTNGHRGEVSVPNQSRVRSVKEDGAFIIRIGPTLTIAQLEEVREEIIHNKSGRSSNSSLASSIGRALGKTLISCLIDLLFEEYEKISVRSSIARHLRFEVPTSAFVSSYPVPTLRDLHSGSSVFVRKTTIRQSQKVTATHSYYGRNERHDAVMIEGNEDDTRYNSELFFPAWFGRAMLFMRLTVKPSDQQITGNVNAVMGNTVVKEFCFLQYYQVVDKVRLPPDQIDSTLNCVRLQWHRTAGDNAYYSAPEFGIVPVESIRGRVHIVPADFAMDVIGDHVDRKQKLRYIACEENGWTSRLFYVNRFHKGQGELYEVDELVV